jgi:hypothetical protein
MNSYLDCPAGRPLWVVKEKEPNSGRNAVLRHAALLAPDYHLLLKSEHNSALNLSQYL